MVILQGIIHGIGGALAQIETRIEETLSRKHGNSRNHSQELQKQSSKGQIVTSTTMQNQPAFCGRDTDREEATSVPLAGPARVHNVSGTVK